MAMLPPMTTPPVVVAAHASHVSRTWAVVATIGAAVFGTLSVAAFVSAWHTQQRVHSLE